MLKAGQLIEVGLRRGVVRRVDRRVGVAAVETESGYVDLRVDDEASAEYRVIADLTTEWPVLHLPDRPRHGSFVTLIRERPLIPLVDFVPTTMVGRVAALFVNPLLNLTVGDVLTGQYERGLVRIDIKRELVTVVEATKKAEERPRSTQSVTAYDQIDRILARETDDEK